MNEQHTIDTILDDALDTYPLQPLPDRFIQRVMTRIAPEPEPFRLRWEDAFLSLAIALLFGLGLIIGVDTIMAELVAWIGRFGWVDAMRNARLELSAGIVIVECLLGLALYVGFWNEGFEL